MLQRKNDSCKLGGMHHRRTCMRENTRARNIFLLCALLLAGLMIYSSPDKSSSDSADDGALAILGAADSGSDRSSRPPLRNTDPGSSIFDSEYMQQGVGENNLPDQPGARADDSEPDILEPVSKGNPINPQTGTPFTDRHMAQFDKLRQKFPDNSVIPRRQTPELKAQMEEKRQAIYEIQTKIVKKDASTEEVNQYYDYQQKAMTDRLELINYVLDKDSEKISDEMREKLEKVKEMNQRSLKSYEDARTRALNAINN